MKFSTWEIIRSYLFGVILEKSSSKINPYLEVSLVNNKPRLNAGKVNYSFGALHRIFQKSFQHFGIQTSDIRDVLILGFGAGSIASILVDEYHMDCRITGVEADPEVMRLTEKYFAPEHYPDLAIILEDACSFAGHHDRTYDLVVIDVYDDFKVPACCETKSFIGNVNGLLKTEGLVLFNKMIFNKSDEQRATNLVKHFEEEFSHVQEFIIHDGIRHMIIAGMNQSSFKV